MVRVPLGEHNQGGGKKNLLGREVTICERNTRVSKEEGGGAAPEVRLEIPRQLMVQTGRSRDPPAAWSRCRTWSRWMPAFLEEFKARLNGAVSNLS